MNRGKAQSDVVILAAGVGSRLRPLTDEVPKCMVRVGDERIIERIISQLAEAKEVGNIYVLTGYKHAMLSDYLSEHFPEVHCIENKNYRETNNMYSLHLFFEQWNKQTDVVMLNADCVFEDQIVRDCVSYSGSCIMADSSTFLEESMKIKIEEGQVKAISKKLTQQGDRVWTSIDLYKFEEQVAEKLSRIVADYIANGDLNQWTEVAINDLVSKSEASVDAQNINARKWFEIDTIEDLEEAKKLFSYVN